MSAVTDGPHIMVLGTGEIARCIVAQAHAAGYAVTVCDPRAADARFPDGVTRVTKVFADTPWDLAPKTHAIVARAHDGDPESVASLLNHGAERVYLIASARRAERVIVEAGAQLAKSALLQRLSAPAGIELGGNGSGEIALSILAEIQWRIHGGTRAPLTDLRRERAGQVQAQADQQSCPGKRP